MKRIFQLALIAPLLSLVTIASTAQSAEVSGFSPQGTVRAVRQVRATFSEAMVPNGQPNASAPFEIECKEKGAGRWIDSQNWIYDFNRDLPTEVGCAFTIKKNLKTLNGEALTENKFEFKTGTPSIVNTNPYEGSDVAEDQMFALQFDGEVQAADVAKSVSLSISGVESRVAVELVGAGDLAALKNFSFIKENAKQLGKTVFVVRTKQRFPNESKLRLQWQGSERIFEYQVRPVFRAELTCERENAKAPCSPITAPSIQFKAEVRVADAKRLRLKTPGGKRVEPVGLEKSKDTEDVSSVTFPKPLEANATYVIEIPSDVKDISGRSLANAKNFPLEFKTAAYPPLVKFAAPFGAIESGSPVLPVTVRAVEPKLAVSQLDMRTLKVASTEQDFLKWAYKIADNDWNSDRNKSILADAPKGADIKRSLLPRPGGAQDFEVIGIPLSGVGLHIVEVESAILGKALIAGGRPMYVASAALVTDLSVHLKYSNERSLVWVTRLSNGLPVEKADVSVYSCNGKKLASGVTNASGLLLIDKLDLPSAEARETACNDDRYELMAVASLGKDRSFVVNTWDRGIEPYRFGVPFDYEMKANNKRIQPILSRSLLRAGETLHMKHVARMTAGTGFRYPTPAELPVVVAIQHSGSDELYKFDLKFDAQGIAVNEWKIPKEAKLGTYTITYLDNKTAKPDWSTVSSDSFRVEEFKVPFLKGTIQTDGGTFIQPKSVNANFGLQYLSGGAASGEKVLVRYQFGERGAIYFPDLDGFSFGEEKIAERTTRSSDDEASESEQPAARGYKTLPMTLDTAGTAKASLTLPAKAQTRPGTLQIEMEYRDPNGNVETASSSVQTYSSDILVGIQPSAWETTTESVKLTAVVVDLKGNPQPGVKVQIEQFTRQYYSYRKKLVGGFFGYESSTETKRLGAFCDGTTDAKGRLFCDRPAKTDGEIIFQAIAKDSKGRETYSSRSVSVYRKDRIWFDVSDDDRMDVLTDVKQYEAGQTAKYQIRMPFKKAVALVTVEREGILDAFVTTVNGEKPEIEVKVRPEYSPNAYVSVLAVRGRVDEYKPTALVDLGRPSFKLGLGKMQVGWSGHELKVKAETDKPVYQTRGKATVKINVTPALAASGVKLPKNSEVAVAVVDQALLELMPNGTWDLLSKMMQERAYGVRTSTLQTNVIGKRHFGKKALASGGGGGRSATRELFDTLVLWQARVQVNANGEASVVVPLNDSISKFTVAVIATGGEQYFGKGETTFTTTKDLQVIPGLPLIVRDGDKFDLQVTVRNATTKELKPNVSVEAGAQKLAPKAVAIAPNGSQLVSWSIAVPADAQSMKFVVRANAGKVEDSVSMSVPVFPAVPVTTLQATLQQATPEFKAPIEYPKEALVGKGEVRISMKAKLGDSLEPVKQAMRDYPWSCFEQRLSKALVLGDTKAWKDLSLAIPSYLDGNGLLKYWPDSPWGSDVLTSYVLSITNEAGWAIPEASLNKMRAGLKDFVEGKTENNGRQMETQYTQRRKLAALEALSRYGVEAIPLISTLQLTPQTWSTASLLDWWSILRHWPTAPNRATRLTEANQILRARLDFRGTRLGFSTEKDDFYSWFMSSPDQNAARLMLGALVDESWKKDAPRLARGVMDRRKFGVWYNTTANAWNVIAMQKFGREFEKVAVSGKTNISMGAQAKAYDWVGAGASGGVVELNRPAAREELKVQHTGAGQPWVTMEIRAAVPLKAPTSNGFKVKREISAIQRKSPNVWSRGDIIRVKLSFDSQTDSTWVVLQDSIPAGASILGTGLGRDSRLTSSGEKSSGAWATFQESAADSYRAYFEYVDKGSSSIEYTIRLNQSGLFTLPPTRMQAMYAPDLLGETPNGVFEVKE